MAAPTMRSEDVRAALARKFGAPEYALFYEVGDATGGRHTRSADAIAMGLWPSRGLNLQGFEIKVSRSDWLNELRNPAKAEPIARFCSFWWIVTPPGIVKDDELPEGWGLYEVKGSGIVCVKPAPKLEPIPITMTFLAALLRRADEHAKASVNAAVREKTRDIADSADKRIAEQVKQAKQTFMSEDAEARETLEAIKKAAGMGPGNGTDAAFRGWFDAAEFGRAVGMVRKMGIAKTYGGLNRIMDTIQPLVKMAEEVKPLLAAMGEDLDST